MDIQTWTFIIVGITFAVYIGIAIWSRAGSTSEFYVAGGGVHPVANGMATAADWMSAASFISMAGIISFVGYDGSVYLMGWTGGYVLLALCLAPYLLEKLDGITQELGFTAYTDGSKSMVDVFFICAALMVGTAGLPHVIIRFFTVPKIKDARISAGWALIFIAILYTTAPAVAAFAKINLIDTINGPDMKGVSAEQAPSWVTNWEKTGLVSWQDKNGDGKMFYSGDDRNEMTINRDIIVLASPELAKLPNWVVALLAAGGLAAALSTAAGLLLVISTSISHDLLKKGFKPNMTDKQELLAARLGAIVAIVGAGYLGINPPGFVAQVVAFSFGLAASSFFPAIILGIFYKRMNKEGAISGMIAGIAFTTAYIIYFKFINPAANTPENWWFGISPEGIGTLGMCLNFVVAIVVNKFTAEVPNDVQEMVESIRYPQGAGEAHDH
ncbi:sodium:solute symporter family protein [Photobacterium damselae]|uniref:sodium:solute symporter family protein n=1 Tax=Photobacterium damselae TaxID=38293 RepID=UPI0018A38371|nr:sodium:solute symporter family protein [Photobacterium damselae]QOQ68446.1 cation acetate symporter [Photobacterium damselae subsp. damselae]